MSAANALDPRIRSELAQLAACMMTESGLHWHEARTKAARRLGVDLLTRNLPDEREIKAALVLHQALYEPNHEAIVAHLRGAARQAMRLLREFDPRLVGPVAEGTATAHADIEIVLQADSEKDVELVLLNAGVGYRAISANPRGESTLRCDDADPIVELTIRAHGMRRRPGGHKQSGKLMLDLAELEALLKAD